MYAGLLNGDYKCACNMGCVLMSKMLYWLNCFKVVLLQLLARLYGLKNGIELLIIKDYLSLFLLCTVYA